MGFGRNSFHLLVLAILFALFAFNDPFAPHLELETLDASASLQDKELLYQKEINALLSPYLFKGLLEQKYHVETIELSGDTIACQRFFDKFSSKDHLLSMEAKRISFHDSDQTWTLCHCSNAKVGEAVKWNYLFSHLSRIPLILRSKITTVISFPTEYSPLLTEERRTIQPHGLMSESTAVFFGEAPFGTWVHEFSHALDVNNNPARFTSSKIWNEALKQDTCVTDQYAKKSTEEALAQAFILKTYLLAHLQPPGAITFLDDHSCMKHQLDALDCLILGTSQQSTNTELLSRCSEGDPKQASVHATLTWQELWLITALVYLLLIAAC